jgi:hypothetical protein
MLYSTGPWFIASLVMILRETGVYVAEFGPESISETILNLEVRVHSLFYFTCQFT